MVTVNLTKSNIRRGDIILTPGGLKSQIPEAGSTFTRKVEEARRTGGSGGGGSRRRRSTDTSNLDNITEPVKVEQQSEKPKVEIQVKDTTRYELPRNVIERIRREQQDREIYDDRTKRFVSASESSSQGTRIERLPTEEEKKKIEISKQRGGDFKEIKTKIKEDPRQIIFIGSQLAAETVIEAGKGADLFFKKLPLKISTKTPQGGEILKVKIPEITRRQQREILSSAFTFAAFEPLVMTATASQQSAYTEVVDPTTGARRFIRKSDVADYLNRPVIEGRIVKSPSFTEKSSRVKELIRRASTEEELIKIKQIVKEEFGESFLKDFQEQQGVTFTKPKTDFTVIDVGKPKIVEPKSQLGNLKGKSYIEVGTNLDLKDKNKTKNKGITITTNKPGVTTSFRSGIDFIKVTDTTNTGLGQSGGSKNRTKTKTEQKPLVDVVFKPINKPEVSQSPETKNTNTNNFLRPERNQRVEPKKTRFPILKPDKSSSLSSPKTTAPNLFTALRRIAGKDVPFATAPTASQAFGKLFRGLRKDLSASGEVLSPTGKKVSPGFLPLDFRLSKKSKTRVVEKKSSRLRKGTTGKQIQYFRKPKGGKNLLGL